jgi:hypothetical protein
MIPAVRRRALGALLIAAMSTLTLAAPSVSEAAPRHRGRAPAAHVARVRPGLRVSVQPIEGDLGPALRGQVARLLRGRGCRVVTTLPRVAGTGQYPGLAKDHRLAAFVTADLEEGRGRQSITFLVWDGASGSVLGRWTASGSSKNLPKAVAKGFWKALGPRFEGAQAPPSDELEPAPPMYVDAGEPLR